MIARVRIKGPDGDIIRDRYLGGGPFGGTDVRQVRYIHEPDAIGATGIDQMLPNKVIGQLDASESKRNAQRRWLRKKAAAAEARA